MSKLEIEIKRTRNGRFMVVASNGAKDGPYQFRRDAENRAETLKKEIEDLTFVDYETVEIEQ